MGSLLRTIGLACAAVLAAGVQSPSSISGSVLDANTLTGIPNVTVKIRSGVSAVTNTHGRYTFHGLGPGRYTVQCEAPRGYANHTPSLRKSVTIPEPGPQLTVDFRLQSGQSIQGAVVGPGGSPIANAVVKGRWQGPDIETNSNQDGTFILTDFAAWQNVELTAAADGLVAEPSRHEVPAGGLDGVVIQMQRAASVEGVIVDQQNQPMRGVPVSWSYRLHGNSSNVRKSLAETDDNGRFNARQLLPAEYVFAVHPPRGRARTILRTTLDEGEQRHGLRLVYSPTAGKKIAGQITDSNGIPLNGVRFSAVSPDAQAQTKTGPDGHFTFYDLPDDSYQLTYFEYQGNIYHHAPRARPGDTDVKIKLRLKPPARRNQPRDPIEGRVIDGKTQRPITHFEYRVKSGPYKEIDERLWELAGKHFNGFFDSGNWKPVNNPEGAFHLRTYSEVNSFALRAVGYGVFRKVIGPTNEPLEIVLQPELRLEGIVRDHTGQPVLGAHLVLGEAIWYPPVKPYRETESRSDETGHYSVGHLSRGDVTVTAWHEDWGSRTETLSLTNPVTRHDFTLPVTGELTGFVLLDGKPINDVSFWLYENDTDKLLYAGAGGACMDEQNRISLKRLDPGQVRISIKTDLYDRGNVPSLLEEKIVTVEAGKRTDVTFDLTSPDD